MKAICTSYNKTDKGLVLRNNWVEDIKNLNHLEDFLAEFLGAVSLKYAFGSIKRAVEQEKFEISSIIEGEMDLDNVVIHIRVVN